MTSPLHTLLSRLEALEKEATPGPWYSQESRHSDDNSYMGHVIHDGKTGYGDDVIADMDRDKPEEPANAQLIVELRNALPTLIEIVKVQQDALESIGASILGSDEVANEAIARVNALAGEINKGEK